MKLWVGLGNPGADYAGHRHNIGFMALDQIAKDHHFAPWRRAFQGHVAEGHLGDARVILLKPDTFMNASGEAVRAAMTFYKLPIDEITVFHDELDLAPGKLRVKQGGGHAGHNGLRSIHAHVGEAYQRVRLGIGHPGHKDAVAGYVLHDFAKSEQDWLADLLQGIAAAAPTLAAGDGPGFLNAVALRLTPPRTNSHRPEAQAAKRPAAKADPVAEDPVAADPVDKTPDAQKSALQRLAARFRG
jgi:PTH1 family peptidyl-tRNA hydrolase